MNRTIPARKGIAIVKAALTGIDALAAIDAADLDWTVKD
jgi:hypothetical protein